MEDQLSISINKLQHAGIPVTDITRSAAFYSRFGFKNVMQSPFTFDGETGTCIMMQLKDIIIELYQMPAKQLEEIKSRKNGHVDHIAFDVDDVDAVFKTLKADGTIKILENAPVFLPFWKNGCKYFNIQGPDGEVLEFNEIIK
ncbi:MAG: putative lyase [Mucilaginibacter sp.]|jgi:catechol 2,3-dioxygenase-like lactoylglutathione lyase family enzyme|nr:putative lyase [Mucilaginibacter sp.]MDB5015738.1 putative lyase [Mucilaginibacter sp.]